MNNTINDTAKVNDGLRSMISGLGDPERDKAASSRFVRKIITDDELISAYEGNWIARKLVKIPAQDSLRKWRRWSDHSRDVLEAEENRLDIKKKIMQALIKGRLFGGAAAYIGTDQDPSEPLDVDSIGLGGIKYINVMTRLELNAGQVETDPLSEFYGTPREYLISSSKSGTVTIHPSRLVIFNGDDKADNIIGATSYSGWAGISVVQSTYDAISNAQGAFSNVASLLYEANIDVVKIPDLMANIGNEGYESSLIKRLALAAKTKGINGMMILDALEDQSRNSASFNQLPQLMEVFALHAAAAADIPATRFLAQSPTGLAATGESDMKNYHDMLQSIQELEIGPAMKYLDRCLIRSALKTDEPIEYTWSPLQQMNDLELSKLGKETAETVKIMFDIGAITGEEARELLLHKLSENGAFPHIDTVLSSDVDLDGVVGGLDT